MKPGATGSEIDAVVKVVEAVGFRAHPMPGATRTAIGITGNEGPIDNQRFENLAGVAEVIRVTKPYKLITLDLRPDQTVVRVGDATIGDSELAIIAGPCAIESRDQAFAIAVNDVNEAPVAHGDAVAVRGHAGHAEPQVDQDGDQQHPERDQRDESDLEQQRLLPRPRYNGCIELTGSSRRQRRNRPIFCSRL